MVDKELEGVTPQIKGAMPTPEEEGAKPTPLRVEPTIKTYTQKDLDEAVGKGLASIQQQLSLQKTEAAKAQAEVNRLKLLHQEVEAERDAIQQEAERFLEEHDPDALAGYRNTKAIQAREKKLAQKEQELRLIKAEQEGLRQAIILNNKANELQVKYRVPREVLEACSSEEQMETIARAFPEVGAEKPKVEKTPRFETGVSSGSGFPVHPSIEQLDKMTPKQYAEWYEARKNKGRK